MKKTIFFFFFLISINAFAGKSEYGNIGLESTGDTTVIPQILALPLASYIGKPVDSLLSILPQSFDRKSFLPARLGYMKGIYLSYGTHESNICHVEIFWDTIQHLPVPNYNPSAGWDMSLAKLETISYIKVIKNNTICIYGCHNPRYY